MYQYPADIYTEPKPDTATLANLGPLVRMAGIWTSADGMDVNPKPKGPEHQPFIERYELQPIDAQTNGPQLFYGLRYHTRILKRTIRRPFMTRSATGCGSRPLARFC